MSSLLKRFKKYQTQLCRWVRSWCAKAPASGDHRFTGGYISYLQRTDGHLWSAGRKTSTWPIRDYVPACERRHLPMSRRNFQRALAARHLAYACTYSRLSIWTVDAIYHYDAPDSTRPLSKNRGLSTSRTSFTRFVPQGSITAWCWATIVKSRAFAVSPMMLPLHGWVYMIFALWIKTNLDSCNRSPLKQLQEKFYSQLKLTPLSVLLRCRYHFHQWLDDGKFLQDQQIFQTRPILQKGYAERLKINPSTPVWKWQMVFVSGSNSYIFQRKSSRLLPLP